MNSPHDATPHDGRQPHHQSEHQPWGPAAPPIPPVRRSRARLWLRLAPLLVIVLAAAITAALLLSGSDMATLNPPPTATGASPPATGSATPSAPDGGMPAETHTPVPQDRDMEAVVAALRAIDPCALVDPAVARQRGRPGATAYATGPHACSLYAAADPMPGDPAVTVRVGAYSDQLLRYSGAPVTIAGAKAYQYAGGGPYPRCQLDIPVSFTLAIEFSYRLTGGGDDLCAVLRQYAETAVSALRNPAGLAAAHTPYSAWDGCVLLAAALREDAAKYTYRPEGDQDPLSGCGTHPVGASEVGPGIEVHYDSRADIGGPSRSISGRTVALKQLTGQMQGTDHCNATWDDGPSGIQQEWNARVTVKVAALTCDTAAALVERVMGLATTTPPRKAAPATDLLYAPDDHDTVARGACVDLGIAYAMPDCEPYQDVPLASSPQQILGDAARNRNVHCRVFHDAVTAVYGTQFAPVTWDGNCYFVDAKHDVRIQAKVHPTYAPSGCGQGPGAADGRETTIAGKAAITFTSNDRENYDICLSPTGRLREPGTLHLRLQGESGRGKDTSGPVFTVLPQDALAKADKAMTAVVEKYFK